MLLIINNFSGFGNTTKKTSVPHVFLKSWKNLFYQIRCYLNAILLKLKTTMCANVDSNEVSPTLSMHNEKYALN